jgi:dTDP-4-dehydrorhamnose reductase
MTVGCHSRLAVDVRHPDSLERAFEAFKPDIIVNPAAYTAVDRAEQEPELAFAINRDGAGHAAMVAKNSGIPIIHLSTDYVFDGSKSGAYVESDPVSPQTLYGRSKLAGELAVTAANERSIILRTSWVYSPFGNNFVRTMMRLASERDELRIVDDQIGCPTYAPDIADAILDIAQIVRMNGWQSHFAGVTHLAGPDAMTWFGFARDIMHAAKARGRRAVVVNPITSAEYPTPARRPKNSCLNCERLYLTFNVRIPAFSISLDACLDRLFEARE